MSTTGSVNSLAYSKSITPLGSLTETGYVKSDEAHKSTTHLYSPGEGADLYLQQPQGIVLFNWEKDPELVKEKFQSKLALKIENMFYLKNALYSWIRPLKIYAGNNKNELRVVLDIKYKDVDRKVLYEMAMEFFPLFPPQIDPYKQMAVKFHFEENVEHPKNRGNEENVNHPKNKENVVLIFKDRIVEYPSKNNTEKREDFSFTELDKNVRGTEVTEVVKTKDGKLIFEKKVAGVMKYISEGEFNAINAKLDYINKRKEEGKETKNASLKIFVLQVVTTTHGMKKWRCVEERGVSGREFFKQYKKNSENPTSIVNMFLCIMNLLLALGIDEELLNGNGDLKLDNLLLKMKLHGLLSLVEETITSDLFWKFDPKKPLVPQVQTVPKGSSRMSAPYVSPESGENPDLYTPKADMWSFAILLIEIILGEEKESILCRDPKKHPLPMLYKFIQLNPKSNRLTPTTKSPKEIDDKDIADAIAVLQKVIDKDSVPLRKQLKQFLLELVNHCLIVEVKKRCGAQELMGKVLEMHLPNQVELKKVWADPVNYVSGILVR
ncbi:MAG: protein kinase [Chlamydiae bacterium]|nr:protein kinase [Chlamydiota bacterium]